MYSELIYHGNNQIVIRTAKGSDLSHIEMTLTAYCYALFYQLFEVQILQGEIKESPDGLMQVKFVLDNQNTEVLRQALVNVIYGEQNSN
jgi:hypothetical protein